MILKYLERLIPAFSDQPCEPPPANLFAFCRYYARGMEIPLVVLSLLTAVLASLEVYLFNFMGQLVDWLAVIEPEQLWPLYGEKLLLMGFVLLLALPLISFLRSAVMHQALMGNFPMSVRWLIHRYLLKQSLGFFQDEFAGRLSTKVMQTALAVRDSVLKLLDVMVYILVYFASIVVLIGQLDSRLLIPLLCWLLAYIALQIYVLPRMKRISMEQADARSAMTGRIVDSYTNIATVKLFAHTQQEAKYAKSSMQDFMSTVYRQMRLGTLISSGIQALNYLLFFLWALWLFIYGVIP